MDLKLAWGIRKIGHVEDGSKSGLGFHVNSSWKSLANDFGACAQEPQANFRAIPKDEPLFNVGERFQNVPDTCAP